MAPRRAGADTRLRVPWVPDAEAQACGPCGKSFSVFLRRHHCRCCGGYVCYRDSPTPPTPPPNFLPPPSSCYSLDKHTHTYSVFCNTCSPGSRSGLPGYVGPQRICNACAKAVDQRPSSPSTPPPTPLLAELPPSTEATPDERHLQQSSAAAAAAATPPATTPPPLRIPTLRIGDDSDGGAAAAAHAFSNRLLPLSSPSVAAAAAASLRRLPPPASAAAAAAAAASSTTPPLAQGGGAPRRRPLRRRQAATPPPGSSLPLPRSPRGGGGGSEADGDGACRACLAPAAAHAALFAVRVAVHEARGLATGRLTAPNVSFVLRAGEGGHEAGRTRTVRASHAPRFDEAFDVRVAAPTDSLYVTAYDEGVLADHVLGRACVPLSTLGAGGGLHRVWLHLLPCESAYQASHRFRSGVRASHMKRPRGCAGGADEGAAAVAGAPLGAVCVSVSTALSAANPYAYLALFCDGEERRRRDERRRRRRHRRHSSHLRAEVRPSVAAAAAAAAAEEEDSDASSADAAGVEAEAVSSEWDSSAPSSGLFSLGDRDSDWSDSNEAAAAAAAAAATVAEAEEFQAQELVMHARRLWDLWGGRTPAMMEALLRLPKVVRAVVAVPTWGCVVVWGAGVGPAAAPLLLLLAAALDALAKEPYEPERVPVFEPAEEATAPVSRRLRKAYRTVHEFPLLLAKIQWGLAGLASFFEKLGFLLSFVHPTLSLAFFAALAVACVAASLLLCVVPVRLVVFLVGARVIMQGGRRSRWVHRLTRRPKRCVRWVAALVLHFWRNVPDVLEVEHRAIAVAVRSGVPPQTQHRGGGRQRRATVLTPRVGGAASGVLFA